MGSKSIAHAEVKHGFTTHPVPLESMVGTTPFEQPPRIGDLVLAQVVSVGHHKRLEQRNGTTWHIFPGDQVMTAFGNRYATDQYEAYVPKAPVPECDLVSVGGVCGEVLSQHPSMNQPTRLRVLGGVCGNDGQIVNLRSFGLPRREWTQRVVLVVGSSMNSGKTTTVGTLVRALRAGGFSVAAAKTTGTAAGKDSRYFTSCGARPVVDFTHAGFPSTYMIDLPELLHIHDTLVGHLQESAPDFIVVEVADGIFQRETRMLLDDEQFRSKIDHVFFAANDSLSANCGARCLTDYNLPLRAVTGAFSQSRLALKEAEATVKVPCLNIAQMLAGGALEAMGVTSRVQTLATFQPPEYAPTAEAAEHSNGNGRTGNGHTNGNGETGRGQEATFSSSDEQDAPQRLADDAVMA